MTPQEIAQIITLVRRAPLANMAEAEAASQLLQKLAAEYAPKSVEPSSATAQPDNG
jgi:hypothetical protein